MYVCVCNAIREAEFRSAAADLAEEASVKGVFGRLERQPRCGSCLKHARRLLEDLWAHRPAEGSEEKGASLASPYRHATAPLEGDAAA